MNRLTDNAKEDGDAFVIQAGPGFELLGTDSLRELCMAKPAIVDVRLTIPIF